MTWRHIGHVDELSPHFIGQVAMLMVNRGMTREEAEREARENLGMPSKGG
ncbi:hypothetical protein MINTMi27_15530 [Mycobacterium intracellulare]|nr:hypothetical protein MINTMi27_15530 [Mycobacterium intracellulare]